jgi:hypothetical protein
MLEREMDNKRIGVIGHGLMGTAMSSGCSSTAFRSSYVDHRVGHHFQSEIPLFNPASPANYCSLFQKDCAVGETILISKWVVPIFFP